MRVISAALIVAFLTSITACSSAVENDVTDKKEPAAKEPAVADVVTVAAQEAEPAEKEPAKDDADKKEAPKTSAEESMAKLEEILQREAKTEEELSINIKDAVSTCEQIAADKTATPDMVLNAENAMLDLMAQGAANNLDGFKDKLQAKFDTLKKADPPSPLLPKASFHLIRLNHTDADGKLKPEVMDAINQFITDFPTQRGMAIRLLMDAGEAADATGDTPLAIKAFSTIKEKFPDHQIVEVIEGTLRRLEAVGKEFPLELTLISGDKLDPAALKDKVVIVDFWATWCGPCIASMPRLKELYEELHGKGLEIVGVSLDEEKAELEAFIEEEKLPWPQTFPADGQGTGWEHPLTNKYGISGIPALFLIGRDGKLVSTSLHGKALEEKVRELLDATPKS